MIKNRVNDAQNSTVETHGSFLISCPINDRPMASGNKDLGFEQQFSKWLFEIFFLSTNLLLFESDFEKNEKKKMFLLFWPIAT